MPLVNGIESAPKQTDVLARGRQSAVGLARRAGKLFEQIYQRIKTVDLLQGPLFDLGVETLLLALDDAKLQSALVIQRGVIVFQQLDHQPLTHDVIDAEQFNLLVWS